MELIFTNGTVRTMDGRVYGAVGVQYGKVAFLGSSAEAKLATSASTRVIDLGGKLMLPGFVDTHMHFQGFGTTLEQADLIPCRSKADIIETGRAFAAAHPELTWIVGSGWNNDHWSDDTTFPNRHDLDRISLEKPVVFSRTCWHIVSLNTKALELNGILDSAPEIPGGQVDIGPDGRPDGILRENACGLAFAAMPESTEEDMRRAIRAASKEAVRCGLTGIHTDDLGDDYGDDLGMTMRAYASLHEADELPMRVYMQCRLSDMKHLERFFELGYGYHDGDDMLRMGPLKLVADGSLGARTAYLSEPYCDMPETRGITCYTQQELDSLICAAAAHGMPGAIHAIGDESITMVLNAFEKARRIEKTPLRHGIIHCQITDMPMLERMRKLNIMALVQPVFLDYDLHMCDSRVGRLAPTSYAFNTMRKLGIPMAFGSDCPVEFFDPIMGIYHAVTRKDKQGFPENGWYPDEKLTVEDAVAGFTSGAAYASDEEDIKGTIALGKLADFVVLDRDIFAIPEDDIKLARADMTVVGGRIVYER